MLKNTVLILSILLTFLLSACTSTTRLRSSSFSEPESETYVSLAPVVWEYFYHRKAAALTGNVDAFYIRYPDLIIDADPLQGINAEAFHASALQSFNVLDGDIFPEYYEPLRVRAQPDQIEILTHGMELYLHQDAAGNFSQTGGEFKIVLFLRPEGGGWTLFRTHQVTLDQWKDFNP